MFIFIIAELVVGFMALRKMARYQAFRYENNIRISSKPVEVG